ncbi:hypothetical protein [Treponema zioleckii]|uniref:hypothetical protein n=1 Tax=Treponema zioleckii TaxID=331680 RepID=UPI00168B385A|nr:hypothetical protein [Treponema zioleckii]
MMNNEQGFRIMGKLTKKLSERERKNGFYERLQSEAQVFIENLRETYKPSFLF